MKRKKRKERGWDAIERGKVAEMPANFGAGMSPVSHSQLMM
jgi:hypothetical protein